MLEASKKYHVVVDQPRNSLPKPAPTGYDLIDVGQRPMGSISSAGGAMGMKDTVLEFVARINAHDVAGILDLMADDYRFINSAGHAVRGKAFMRATWRAHFVQYPDFQIRADRVLADTESFCIFGRAQLSYNPLYGHNLEANQWELTDSF